MSRVLAASAAILLALPCRADPLTYAPPAGATEGQLPDVSEHDVVRFPPADVLQRDMDFQGAHLAWLNARMAYSQDDRLRLYDYREDLKRRVEVYAAALCAARQGPGGAGPPDGPPCRASLRELRGLIGAAAYSRGELPACVDWGAFSRADR